MNIHLVSQGIGELPRNFFKLASGKMTYTRLNGTQIIISRDDVHAVDKFNIGLLNDGEKQIIRESVSFFAHNSTALQIALVMKD